MPRINQGGIAYRKRFLTLSPAVVACRPDFSPARRRIEQKVESREEADVSLGNTMPANRQAAPAVYYLLSTFWHAVSFPPAFAYRLEQLVVQDLFCTTSYGK